MKDTYARTNNICLVFLTLFAGTFALIYMKPMLIPLIFAIFFYAALTPLVQFIRLKFKAPKGVAILFALLTFSLLLGLVVVVVISSVENFVVGLPKYHESLKATLALLQNQLSRYSIEMDSARLQKLFRPMLAHAQSFTGLLLNFLGNLFLVFIFTIFMMAGDSQTQEKSPLLKEILKKISSYINSKFFLSIVTGFLVWLVLLSFSIELAFLFALLTVLLNFIPTIGSIVAVALPLPIVFLQYQFTWPFFAILALTGVIQFAVGNIIEPMLMGDTMDLHPITILGCLVFWGMVWGVSGMFLAVPITAIIKIVFARIEATQVLAEILAGRLPSK